jgi:ribose transport system permease protein
LSTFAGAGLLYGLAGVLVAAFIATPDISVGSPYQLASITVVAIAGAAFSGGPASISSVLCASVFLTMLDQSLMVRGLSAGARVIAQGVALVVAIAVITIGQYANASVRRLLHRAPRGSVLPAVDRGFVTVGHADNDAEAGHE